LNQAASLNSFSPSNSQGIELLRSSDGTWTVYPGLRFACPGLSKFDACGVKKHEASLHFCITILARALYNINISMNLYLANMKTRPAKDINFRQFTDKELSENKHYIFHYYIVQNFLKAS
jgi:hypothetical protein